MDFSSKTQGTVCCTLVVVGKCKRDVAQSENEEKTGGLLRPGLEGALNQMDCSRLAFPLIAPVIVDKL